MLGATSVDGPPIVLYLLSGPDPVATTRANLTLFVTVTTLAGLAALWHHDALDRSVLSRRRCGLRCPISSGCSPERTCFRS